MEMMRRKHVTQHIPAGGAPCIFHLVLLSLKLMMMMHTPIVFVVWGMGQCGAGRVRAGEYYCITAPRIAFDAVTGRWVRGDKTEFY